MTTGRAPDLVSGAYRALFDANPRPMWVCEQETLALLAANDAACALYGWSRDEMCAMRVDDLRADGEAARFDRFVEELRQGEQRTSSTTRDLRHKTKSGAAIHVDVEIARLDFDGRLAGLAIVTKVSAGDDDRDLQLLEAQHRLEYMLSATAAVTYVARASGDYGATFVSANVKDIIGYDARELVESPTFWYDHIHPDDRRMVEDFIRRLFDVGEHSVQYRFRHADGRFRWMLDAPRVVRDEDGKAKEVVGYWIDVTERVQAEHALRGSEANFRTVIERSPNAIFVHRGEKVVYANPATVTMLGYDDASELAGHDLLSLVHPDDRDMIRQRIAVTLRDGSASVIEGRMIRRDGRVIVVEAQAVLLDFDGEASSVVLARDGTERHEMFARIAVADRMLSVGTLAAGVAHEINTPLAYMTSSLAILSAELPKLLDGRPGGRTSRADIEELVRDAQEGAARVSGIVRDLRALSRADDHTRGPVDVAAVLQSSLKLARNELRHRARVVTQIDGDLPHVHANASRLGQVFLNLLVNAAQAIHDGHADANEIRVRAHASGDRRCVILEVEDTGVGIAPSILGRIFDPFFTTKPIGVGTGLGLPISHQIVRSVGGEITVTSTPGRGTCFHVTLPAIAEGVASTKTPSSMPPPRGPVRRVLMVDDEPALGRSTRLLLQPDYDVVPVTRAREALERLAAGEDFDVILCDLMMPEMSGIEFHEQLARSCPHYVDRVVYISGGAFTDEARHFLGAVGRASIEKPFTEKALRGALDAIV
jgi:two-component system cell cycle sensor histidine kinase/response regulator CckA